MDATSKLKRNFHSIADRLTALNRLERGESINNVAADIGVHHSTVRKWRRMSAELSAVSGAATMHKSLMKADNEDMENELVLWLSEKRLADNPVTDLEIRRKAIEIHRRNGGPAVFQASDGWLQRFNKRYDTKSVLLSGEMASDDDKPAADVFVPNFCAEVEEESYERDDIYNFDEGGVCYKALPSRSYILGSEKCPRGTKVQKDRITMGVCANASGTHKLPLLIIGKSAMPRCFRSRKDIDKLPVIYRANKKAWMTQRLWLEFVQDIFIPEVKQRQLSEDRVGKVILVVDNASSHNTPEEYEFGHFRVVFLPPNTTSMLQPMDQGIIAKIKRVYRRQLVDRLLKANMHIIDFYKTVTVKDACLMLAEAWEEVSTENVKQAWNKLLPPTTTCNTVPPSAPSPDGTMEIILALMRSKDAANSLTDDEAWEWFRGLEAVEAVSEDPDGNPESSDEEGEDRVTLEQARSAWATIKVFMNGCNLMECSGKDIERTLGEAQPITPPTYLS